MIPGIGLLLGGRGAKLVAIAVAAAVLAGSGFYAGKRWMDGTVAKEKIRVVQAQAEAAAATQKKERAEADYLQLRQQVADAMQKGQERAIELEKHHAEAAQRATVGYEKRIASVLDAHRRLLESSAAGGGRDHSGGLPELPSPRCAHDSAAERELIERLRAADESEARLGELQRLIKEQP